MNKNTKHDFLKLKNQLCFPLYATSREVIKLYKNYLDELDLTYTQYIVMSLLWEHEMLTVKELGDSLFLDSGTLTPLLKKLEAKGLVSRIRSTKDERNLNVSITKEGQALREKALKCPMKMEHTCPLTMEESVLLYKLLYKMLGQTDVEIPDWYVESAKQEE